MSKNPIHDELYFVHKSLDKIKLKMNEIFYSNGLVAFIGVSIPTIKNDVCWKTYKLYKPYNWTASSVTQSTQYVLGENPQRKFRRIHAIESSGSSRELSVYSLLKR